MSAECVSVFTPEKKSGSKSIFKKLSFVFRFPLWIYFIYLQFSLSWFETVGCVVSANLGYTNDMSGKST